MYDGYENPGSYVVFLSAEEKNEDAALTTTLIIDDEQPLLDWDSKSFAFSVRCIKDAE